MNIESEFAITDSLIQERRERVFLVLAGVFLCAMTLLNVIGITRFVQLGPMQLAVGVLAYPLTFLCTDLISEDVILPSGDAIGGKVELFYLLYASTTGAVFASMLAYFFAQYVDVYLFHWIKRKTNGKHLWLRNNGSTMVSQLVDSLTVVSVTFGAAFLAGSMSLGVIFGLMLSNYVFKLVSALVDTPIIYLLVAKLRPYLHLS